MAKKKSSQEPEGSGLDPNAWMATFSDLLTLMLTFFVLLLSMASMDNKALRETFGFFKDRMGLLNKISPTDSKPANQANTPVATFVSNAVISKLKGVSKGQIKPQHIVKLIERSVDTSGLEHLIQARYVPNGIAISIATELLFGKDSTKLSVNAYPILDSMASIIRPSDELNLRIEGVQEKSVGTKDPYDVAIDRSLAIVDYMMGPANVPTRKLSIAAYGSGWSRMGLPGAPSKIELVLTWQEKTFD
jgi:chemotaxis protein MotB